MISPAGAKLEVTVLIDPDQWAQLEEQGMPERQMQQLIEKSVGLRDIPFRYPTMDIESVTLVKYY